MDKKPSLKEYWNMLASHDWFYEFSEDSRVYDAGRESDKKIREAAKTSEEHNKLFVSYYLYKFKNGDKPPAP